MVHSVKISKPQKNYANIFVIWVFPLSPYALLIHQDFYLMLQLGKIDGDQMINLSLLKSEKKLFPHI